MSFVGVFSFFLRLSEEERESFSLEPSFLLRRLSEVGEDLSNCPSKLVRVGRGGSSEEERWPFWGGVLGWLDSREGVSAVTVFLRRPSEGRGDT